MKKKEIKNVMKKSVNDALGKCGDKKEISMSGQKKKKGYISITKAK